MRLADYSSDERCFEFDLRTGAYSHLKLPTPRTNRAGYSGMAQLLRCPRKVKVQVAKYLLEGTRGSPSAPRNGTSSMAHSL
jgi:hypothetical protein